MSCLFTMIFTQKSMTKHLKFYQQRGPGRAGEHAGTSGCRSPWSCSPPPPPPTEPWVQGRGRARSTRWHLLSSLPTVPAPQRLQPGACVSRREGILVSVQGNLPFCRDGAEAQRGEAQRGENPGDPHGTPWEAGSPSLAGVGELAAASSGSDWSSLGQGVRLRTEGSGGLRAQPSTLQRDAGRLAGRVRARCGEGASGLKAGLQVGHRRVGGLENWEEGVS